VIGVHAVVREAQASLHWTPERTLGLLSAVAGAVALLALLRACRHLGRNETERWVLATLLSTAGAMQLFLGHVEYYAILAAALLTMLALQAPLLAASAPGDKVGWIRGLLGLAFYGVLVPLHLSTLALLPAQAFLIHRSRRLLPGGVVFVATLAIPLLALGLVLLSGGSPGDLTATTAGGLRRYLEPYFDTASARHASGLLAPAHWLAFANDVLLTAPLIGTSLACWAAGRRLHWKATPLSYLGLASLCSLIFNFFFARELGAYRDWDIMAPYAFLLLLAAGVSLSAAGLASRVTWLLVLVGGLSHWLPWAAIQTQPERAIAHVRLALGAPSQWSRHARGYMHEELAIYYREQGDRDAVLREYEAAVQANPADARYRVGLGNQLASRGDLEGAAHAYARALETRPDYAPAHNNLAYALSQLRRDLDRARDHARRALMAEPGNADYWLTLARVELATGRTGAAQEALEEALQRRRPFPQARELLESLEP
jgi:tetratricopeptide (TPR) repeat protein